MAGTVRRFGTIISTKAILDKNTNKCKGYGFVDFESPSAAETAVKALQLQGIQAQMAKVIVKVIKTPIFFVSLSLSSLYFSLSQCLCKFVVFQRDPITINMLTHLYIHRDNSHFIRFIINSIRNVKGLG